MSICRVPDLRSVRDPGVVSGVYDSLLSRLAAQLVGAPMRGPISLRRQRGLESLDCHWEIRTIIISELIRISGIFEAFLAYLPKTPMMSKENDFRDIHCYLRH